MPRTKSITTEQLISCLNQFMFDNPEAKVTIPNFGSYIRDNGYDIKDYTIRRNKAFREYLKNIITKNAENDYSEIISYKNLDVDNFLCKHRSRESLKKALVIRDQYYAQIAYRAVEAIKERNKLETDLNKLNAIIKELKAKLTSVQAKADKEELKKKDVLIAKLKRIISNYVYPSFANALLAKEGIIEVSNDIIPEEIIEEYTVNPNINIRNSKYSCVEKLIGGLDD